MRRWHISGAASAAACAMCSTNTRTRSIEPETCGRQREGASWRGGCGSDLEGSSQLPIDEVCVVNNVQVWSVRGQLLEKALHVPQSVCDGAEVALHDAGQELVPVMLRHGAPTVVDDRDKAEQEGGQGTAAAQELQLQELQPPGYGAEQRRVNGIQQSMQGRDPVADDEESGCGVQR